MIKIVVNSPKGGVGKTTIATNAALLLARKGRRVWALDLAQGGLMTAQLGSTPEFQSKNRIQTVELGELPPAFPGSSGFDYLVADTDDYYRILTNLLDEKRRGWRVLCPILPDDHNGLARIPGELGQVMRGSLLLKERPNIRVVINRYPTDPAGARNVVSSALAQEGIEGLLAIGTLPDCRTVPPPFFIDDPAFASAVTDVLKEIGAF